MSKKIIIDLEANTSKAQSELNDILKELKALNKQATQTNESLESGFKDVEKTTKSAGKSLFSFSKILKGTLIIKAISAAFDFFKETLGKNQVVVDLFATTFEALSIAFNDFINFIFNNVGGVVNAFKSIFQDPVQSLIDFKDALVEGVINRFNELVETLGFVAKGIGDLFKGNFKDAVESFKQAGKESIDVITGQDKSFDEVTSTIGNYVKETIKAGKENVKLNKEAEKARVLNQGIIEDYDRQAELLRQTRDDEFKTIDDRIKANNDLKAVLDQQKEAMLANADAILTAAQAQFDKNGNDANAIALQEAKNEKAAIEAQITGFMSEQDSNRNALLREKLELEQSNTDAATERAKVERDFNAEQIENDVLRIQKQKENLEIEKQQELDRLIAKRDAYTLGTQAYADAENERLAFIQEVNNRETELGVQLLEAKKIQAEEERNIEKQKIRDKQMVLDAIGQFADAESGIGKALLIAKQALALQETLLDVKRITFKGQKAVAEAGVSASQNVAESSKIGFPQNIITIAAAIAQGIGIIRSVKKAVSKTKVPIGAATAEVPQVNSGSSTPPAFNVVGASGANQLATAIAGQQEQPVKAFVVSGDVSTAQELDRNIVQGAAIG